MAKMGRPVKPERMDKIIKVYLYHNEWEVLSDIQKETGASYSAIVRDILLQGILIQDEDFTEEMEEMEESNTTT